MSNSFNKKRNESFNEVFESGIRAKNAYEGLQLTNDGNVKTITFQVTENCNLNCTYCYEINKSKKSMTFDVAKEFIDLLIKDSYDENSYINIYNTNAIILDFIGGEPLLEIELIHKVIDYFLYVTISNNHPWSINFMVSMISNGVNYFNPKVQELFEKYKGRVSFSVSLDGCEELHDKCRLFPNGEGSYKIAESACKHYMKNYNSMMSTKMTLAPDNLDYMLDAFKNLINLGYKTIYANPIFEEDWSLESARKYYVQLKKVADHIIDNDNEHDIFTSLFDRNIFTKLSDMDNSNFCGSTGHMLSLDCDGGIYPCIRFMPISLGNIEAYKIGDIKNGIGKVKKYEHKIDILNSVTRRGQSSDECWECPISAGCGHCTAWNYQVTGTPNRKLMYICNMHKARCLANSYYWNKVYVKNNMSDRFKINLDKNECIKFIDINEYNLLVKLQED